MLSRKSKTLSLIKWINADVLLLNYITSQKWNKNIIWNSIRALLRHKNNLINICKDSIISSVKQKNMLLIVIQRWYIFNKNALLHVFHTVQWRSQEEMNMKTCCQKHHKRHRYVYKRDQMHVRPGNFEKMEQVVTLS